MVFYKREGARESEKIFIIDNRLIFNENFVNRNETRIYNFWFKKEVEKGVNSVRRNATYVIRNKDLCTLIHFPITYAACHPKPTPHLSSHPVFLSLSALVNDLHNPLVKLEMLYICTAYSEFIGEVYNSSPN